MEKKQKKVVPISEVDDFDDYDDDTLFVLDDLPLRDPRIESNEDADK